MVETMRLGLPRRFTDILAVSKQTVEVEFVRVFAVSRQAGIAKENKKTLLDKMHADQEE